MAKIRLQMMTSADDDAGCCRTCRWVAGRRQRHRAGPRLAAQHQHGAAAAAAAGRLPHGHPAQAQVRCILKSVPVVWCIYVVLVCAGQILTRILPGQRGSRGGCHDWRSAAGYGAWTCYGRAFRVTSSRARHAAIGIRLRSRAATAGGAWCRKCRHSGSGVCLTAGGGGGSSDRSAASTAADAAAAAAAAAGVARRATGRWRSRRRLAREARGQPAGLDPLSGARRGGDSRAGAAAAAGRRRSSGSRKQTAAGGARCAAAAAAAVSGGGIVSNAGCGTSVVVANLCCSPRLGRSRHFLSSSAPPEWL